MYEDQIKEVNTWFAENEEYETYRHTTKEDGEDVYAVGQYKVDEFIDFLRENVTDLIGINVKIGGGGIWFSSEDLERARFY